MLKIGLLLFFSVETRVTYQIWFQLKLELLLFVSVETGVITTVLGWILKVIIIFLGWNSG